MYLLHREVEVLNLFSRIPMTLNRLCNFSCEVQICTCKELKILF